MYSFASFYFAQQIFEIHSYCCHIAVIHLFSRLNCNPLRTKLYNLSLLPLKDSHGLVSLLLGRPGLSADCAHFLGHTDKRLPEHRPRSSIILGCWRCLHSIHSTCLGHDILFPNTVAPIYNSSSRK